VGAVKVTVGVDHFGFDPEAEFHAQGVYMADQRREALRVDGGMVGNGFLMQFQSDMLGTKVERPVVQETTALGAAYLAGLATGFWKDTQDIGQNWQLDQAFKPKMDRMAARGLYKGWQLAVKAARVFRPKK
jgi:glycerol kinase